MVEDDKKVESEPADVQIVKKSFFALSITCLCGSFFAFSKDVNDAPIVEYKENGDPVVYKRRWFVLMAVAFGYMAWLQHTFKHIPLVAEYARFFDTTNAFEPDEGELGIDFFAIFDGAVVIISYPIAGVMVDRYGLKMVVLGSILQAVSAWWFFVSFSSYASALASRFLASVAGPLIATALLRVSMNWFPPSERAFAVGFAVLLAEAGAGIALLQADFFINDFDEELDLTVKNCPEDFITIANEQNITDCAGDQLLDGQDSCCLFDTNINGLNFAMAIWTSLIALYTMLIVRDHPKSAPSISGLVKKSPGFLQGLQLMFKNKNYAQICLADFIMSGPPQVLFLALSRIVPQSVDGNEIFAAAAALIIALPSAALYSYFLNKSKKFFEFTAAAYTSGFVFWVLATIALLFENDIFDILWLVIGALALIALVLWTVAVYELKLEYVFTKDYYIEGYIVGVDRAIINLSLIVFLSAIPPERADNLEINGGQFTFLVGLIFMFIGTVVVWTTRDKRKYKRLQFEMDNVGKASYIDLDENRDNDFDHLEDKTPEADTEIDKTASMKEALEI